MLKMEVLLAHKVLLFLFASTLSNSKELDLSKFCFYIIYFLERQDKLYSLENDSGPSKLKKFGLVALQGLP